MGTNVAIGIVGLGLVIVAQAAFFRDYQTLGRVLLLVGGICIGRLLR